MIFEALDKAIKSGEPLQVRYFGGSTPGSKREIQPISVNDGKVRARCLSSGETKTFVVEKLELVIEGVASILAGTLPPAAPVYLSMSEFVTHETTRLQAMGWVVQSQDDSISLHRTFKNGKLIQTPDVALQYEPFAHDLGFDGDKVVETNHRDRVRPWVVRAKKQVTKTYGDIGKAQLQFVDFAKSLAPGGKL